MIDSMMTSPAPALTRRPWFWIAFVCVAAASLALAWKLFPTAIPLVNLDVKMSRTDALAAARTLSDRLHMTPANARSAVQFSSDGDAQNYVELEGGGKEAFARLVQGDLYSPYAWDVRLFAAGSIPEVTVRFTPAGAPYGFTRRFAEDYVRDAATKALTPDAARALGEARAHADWDVDFAPWALLEESQETQPSGRVDHHFVYQRADKLGDARVRLRVSVAGDELAELQRFVFIPQDFRRRYAELRSANDTIAAVATLAAGLLYGIGGCIVATLWLGRKGRLLPRPSFTAGAIVGGLMGLMLLAATNNAWFGFDTAQTEASFWARHVGGGIAAMLGGGLVYGLIFMAAEGLSRAAFPWQPQLWKLWSKEGGASVQTLGRQMGGYLFVPIELGLVAIFYFVTNRYLHWWQPSSEMTDPNVLSSAVPALGPIAMSLQAGFMEESLFRAVPLSLGALIGARFGRMRLGIGIAFVLQALVFGAAHANYPGFPAYSRLVELIIPSMIWAAIFLRFGLLPTITLHALFDLSLFSIPLFLVAAPGAWLQRGLIVLAAAVPLVVILFRRLQAGRWLEMPASLFNGGWTPAATSGEALPFEAAPMLGPTGGAALLQRALPVLAVVALVAWALTTQFRSDVPGLTLSRAAAEATADDALRAQGANPADWRRSSSILLASEDAGLWLGHRFVWQEAGPDAYRALIGATLTAPLWEVRYARFSGDVVDRAEEWRITVNNNGSIRQVRHGLPEGRAGESLARADAQSIAEAEVRRHFAVDPAALRLVGADEVARPARKDWVFEWADPRINVGKDGEARMQVVVAGKDVVGSGRTVFVPEAWTTAEKARDGQWAAIKIGAALLMACAGLAALLLGVRSLTQGQTDVHAGIIAGALTFVAMLLGFANNWPGLQFGLSTTDPVASQIALRIGAAFIGALLAGLFVGMLASVGSFAARRAARPLLAGWLPPWGAGAAAAVVVAGFASLIGSLAPRVAPVWPSLNYEGMQWPALGAILGSVGYLSTVAVALFLLAVLARLTTDWTRRLWLVVLILVMLYTLPSLTATDIGPALLGGIAAGVVASGVVLWIFRFDPRAVPAYVATTTLLGAFVGATERGTLHGWLFLALDALFVLVLAFAIERWLSRPVVDGRRTVSPAMPEPVVPAAAVVPSPSE
jgi:hypothetical protein